ncbi:MAG: lactate racemase domain-containing protein [Dehalobacterium sp.]
MTNEFPKVVRVRQKFNTPLLENIPEKIYAEMAPFSARVLPGQKIAVAVGSRGIRNLFLIVSTVVGILKEWGAEPYIVPAMGSHGGATAEGQKEVLASFGVTETNLDVPVISHMDTIEIGQTAQGVPVYFDREAAAADGIILINRIKPHTDFRAPVESGLLKMLAVGLGKQKGAELIHSYGTLGLQTLIPIMAEVINQTLPIICGLGILENARDETADIIALESGQMGEKEPALLIRARELMPKLLADSLDVLVVERMGKNISGTGIDTNIIGRMGIRNQPDPAKPNISRIVVLDLTEESHGNALGVGLADVVSQRLREKIDIEKTYANVVTTSLLDRGFIPLVLPTDREAISVALKTVGRPVDPKDARLMLIRSTLDLEELYLSANLLEEIKDMPEIEIIGVPETLVFSDEGELLTKLD